jgi:hypothetical protein
MPSFECNPNRSDLFHLIKFIKWVATAGLEQLLKRLGESYRSEILWGYMDRWWGLAIKFSSRVAHLIWTKNESFLAFFSSTLKGTSKSIYYVIHLDYRHVDRYRLYSMDISWNFRTKTWCKVKHDLDIGEKKVLSWSHP